MQYILTEEEYNELISYKSKFKELSNTRAKDIYKARLEQQKKQELCDAINTTKDDVSKGDGYDKATLVSKMNNLCKKHRLSTNIPSNMVSAFKNIASVDKRLDKYEIISETYGVSPRVVGQLIRLKEKIQGVRDE